MAFNKVKKDFPQPYHSPKELSAFLLAAYSLVAAFPLFSNPRNKHSFNTFFKAVVSNEIIIISLED